MVEKILAILVALVIMVPCVLIIILNWAIQDEKYREAQKRNKK